MEDLIPGQAEDPPHALKTNARSPIRGQSAALSGAGKGPGEAEQVAHCRDWKVTSISNYGVDVNVYRSK